MQCFPGLTGDSRRGSVRFETTRGTAATQDAVFNDGSMTYFTTGPIGASPDLVIYNDRATHARTQRNANEMFISGAAAHPVLADGGGVGIIFDHHRQIETLLKK